MQRNCEASPENATVPWERSVPVRRNAEQPRLTRSVPCDGAKKGKRSSGNLHGWVQRYLPRGRPKVPREVLQYVRPSPANESCIFAHKKQQAAGADCRNAQQTSSTWWWQLVEVGVEYTRTKGFNVAAVSVLTVARKKSGNSVCGPR